MSTIAAASEPPLIVVIGATGSQGGGVARALLAAKSFRVRAITRNANSDKAKALAEQGATVVEADKNDKASLIKAFKDADGLFLVTDFMGSGASYENEVKQGKNAADAAKEAGVKHVVFSSLEDPRPFVKGKMCEIPSQPGHCVPHFESKAEVEAYLNSLGTPLTVLLPSAFYQNWLTFMQYQPQEDGSFTTADNSGDKPMVPYHDVNDIGHSAAAIFANRGTYLGATVPVFRQALSHADVAKMISEATGLKVNYYFMPDEQYWTLYPGSDDYGNMWQYYREYDNVLKIRQLERTVYVGKTFQDWVHENKDALKAKILSSAK